MTKKQDLQKEILAEVKEGIKPSDLKKKLKRSKSVGDIPQAPPLPVTVESLQDEISVLALQLETATRELTEKDNALTVYSDQLKEKQKEVENLRKQRETNTPELTELDHSLIARHKSIKDWWQQYSKNKELDQELTENVEQTSEELIRQDKKITNLKTQINQLQQEKASLARDLQLVTRLAESRKVPLPDNSDNLNYLRYALYSLVAVWLVLVLFGSWLEEK